MTAEAGRRDGGYPVAYCAPGQRMAAAFTLMLKGEQVARIAEHPWLGGVADVIVISEPPCFPLPPWPAPAGVSPDRGTAPTGSAAFLASLPDLH